MEKGAQAVRDPVPLGFLHGRRMRVQGCNHTRPHHSTAFHTLSSPLQIPRLEGRTGRGICWRTLQPKCTPQVLPLWPVAAWCRGDSRPRSVADCHNSYIHHNGMKNHLCAHRNPLKGSLQPEEDLQGGYGLLLVVVSTQLSSLLTKNTRLVPAKHG